MSVGNIWDKNEPVEEEAPKKPIKLLKYINPAGGGVLSLITGTAAAEYDNIVRLRGDDDCIVMCWDDDIDGESLPHARDIFTAKWNDGVKA